MSLPRPLLTLVLAIGCASATLAQSSAAPLRLQEVIREAHSHRAEILAARAFADAAAARPEIAGALEDPMISPSIDHYPFEMMDEGETGRRYDWSIAIEQRLPLSRVRSHRSRSARADAERTSALADQATLDVIRDVQAAFFMVIERRRMAEVLGQQAQLARELVAAAAARYSAGNGGQADVLRAEAELARTLAQQRALVATIRAAEAMLNTGMGRHAASPLGELQAVFPERALPGFGELLQTALRLRPELRAGEAQIARSTAETDVMRSMSLPMLTVRAGRASTMAEGDGAMLMVGVSVPLWRGALRARISEARAMERMATADLQAMRLMIEGEVAGALADVEAALETRESLAAQIVPRARMALDASLSAYGAGQMTLVAALDAARMWWGAQGELVMADTAVSLAWARLDRAVGRNPGMETP